MKWRGKRGSTDILSFPVNEVTRVFILLKLKILFQFTAPGVFADSQSGEKLLGDLVVCPAAVNRQLKTDMVIHYTTCLSEQPANARQNKNDSVSIETT